MFYVTCIMDVCGELETVGNDKLNRLIVAKIS